MIALSDTILALASPPGRSARAVMRLSGPSAFDAVERLAGDSGRVRGAPGFSGVAVVFQLEGGSLPAWVDVFRAPRSYTREDILEIHLPASPPLVEGLGRALVLAEGVRWAGPGEFTLRAFLNGRIDLSQAEAVAQLISAADKAEARAAQRGLAGEFRLRLDGIARDLTETIALLEAALDFVDEGVPEVEPDEILRRTHGVRERLAGLRQSTRLRLSAPGVAHVVLGGFPNAGKSSLLNAILGRHAALVSSLAGTTRDPVRGNTVHGGTRIEWVDLAGMSSLEPSGKTESSGTSGGAPSVADLDRQLGEEARAAVRRLSSVELEHADLLLWVLDPTDRPEASLAEYRRLDEQRRVLVVNKTDLVNSAVLEQWSPSRWKEAVHLVSARYGSGLSSLVKAVVEHARGSRLSARLVTSPECFLVSAHQESALLCAMDSLERAAEAVVQEVGYECAAADLREALRALEELTGRVTNDEILGHIFARFCVGK